MRAIALLLLGLTLTAFTTPDPVVESVGSDPAVERARMPLDVLRAEGQAPRLGQITLVAGDGDDEAPHWFAVHFATDGRRLSAPGLVIWSVDLSVYCRDRPSKVRSILIGPSGKIWRAPEISVPPGPDRSEDLFSIGSTRPYWEQEPATGLLEAVAGGGRFVVALEDDEGRRWHETEIDALSPPEWQRLFAANLVALRALERDAVPVDDGIRLIAPEEPFTMPSPPRLCPT
ncbi:MAG: hypothetical protein ACT6TH_04615 [Brevundimonas sp.]|uniref:hypothetical protein n=1 Tax=Brevundimonas sp. TaxID=1871086 RepID=UPI004033CFD3